MNRIKKAHVLSWWLCSLAVRALDSRLDGRRFNTGRRDKYWDGWPSSGRQTTSVFHQATQANSAFYPQRHLKWLPAMRRRSAAGS